MKKPPKASEEKAKHQPDWRMGTLTRLRALIRQAVPEVVEEVKWRKPSNPGGVPVWSHPAAGVICTGETYKDKVKVTFARGALLEDSSGLFNSGLEGSTRRAIDLREGDEIDEQAFAALLRAAVALKTSAAGKRGTRSAVRSPSGVRARRRPKGD